jgi:hypothetical protein
MENVPACFGIAKCFCWVHGLLNKYQLSKLNQFSLSGLGVGIVNLHSQKCYLNMRRQRIYHFVNFQ